MYLNNPNCYIVDRILKNKEIRGGTSQSSFMHIRGSSFLFFSQFGEISPFKSKVGIVVGDVEIVIMLNRKQFLEIPNTLACGGGMIYVIVGGVSVRPVGPRVICPRLVPEKVRSRKHNPKRKVSKSRQQKQASGHK